MSGAANPMTAGGGARPQTGAGGATLGRIQAQVADGNYTATIYGLIRDKKYAEAIEILTEQIEANFPKSRAAMSLLAYCYYHVADYEAAARYYEGLMKLCPHVEEYALYHAQSLYKAGLYEESQKVATLIESDAHHQRLSLLSSHCCFEQEQVAECKAYLDKCIEDPDVTVMLGCVLFKEENYEGALAKFTDAMNALGFKADLAYNIALTHYRMKQYGQSLKHIAEIIERGIKEHPELGIGTNTEGLEVRSVGNTPELKETALVEAFNLKSAIEYMMKNYTGAREALTDMPPRSEEELDPVTLHNSALVNMDQDPTNGFKKFNYLLQHPPFPPETFQNLLLFYCKYSYFDLAADVLAENSHLTWKYLSQRSQSLYDFLDGMITAQTSPAEAYRKFDILAQRHIDILRKLTKRISECKDANDTEGVKRALKEYDEAQEEYMPVLMAQAKIYWDIDNYPFVERLFRQAAEFTSEHEGFKLNVAHSFFMQQDRFKEAIKYYEPVVASYADNILNCSAIVLANLCVSYIMTSLNDRAEEVMRTIEREEEKLAFADPEKQPLHLCIVNLVIGTLYCAKGNFEFGITRIIKSLEPYHRKIMTDTWFYAKRCFLALAAALAKHMVQLKDATFEEIGAFFDCAAMYGAKIPATIHPDPSKQDMSERNTVKYEARCLKKLYMQLQDAC